MFEVAQAQLVTDGDPSLRQEMQSWRHTIHAQPETAFEERLTAELVATTLRSFGITAHCGIAETGVVGVLRAGTAARYVGLRADMDALHITELNEFPHRSRHQGRMHACGHDGHTAMLLGAARHLAQTRRFDGTVHFIFQPAEENEGGGRRMIEEGLFERFPMQAVFGLHNLPGLPIGQFSIPVGPALSSFDTFEILIRGKGGHAGMPQRVVDPIVIGSHLITALQSIVSRSLDPLDAAVISVTSLHAGETWNVVPDTAVLRGSVRAFSETVQTKIEMRLKELTAGVCSAFSAQGEVTYQRRYPPTVNWEEQAAQAAQVVIDAFGPDRLISNSRPLMASEDFAYMLREKPGCFALVGNGSGEGCELHHPRYDFNDALLGVGATYWVRLVERLMPV